MVGPNWMISVVNATTATEFDTYSNTNALFQFILVTIKVTYVGPEDTGYYSPESVVLMQTGASENGWSNNAVFYQEEGSSKTYYFQQESLLASVGNNQSVTATYVFAFPTTLTNFMLFFPETRGVSVQLH